MTKPGQDNNLNYVNFLKHFYEYHTEKLKYRYVTCFILKLLARSICNMKYVNYVNFLKYFYEYAPLTYSPLVSTYCEKMPQ